MAGIPPRVSMVCASWPYSMFIPAVTGGMNSPLLTISAKDFGAAVGAVGKNDGYQQDSSLQCQLYEQCRGGFTPAGNAAGRAWPSRLKDQFQPELDRTRTS